jgi:hypothetical protein
MIIRQSETVSKLDGARRQLSTAIELWFNDKDAVSIHSLAYAAYDVIHTLSEKHGRTKKLFLDSDLVKHEYKRIFRDAARRAGNFFKHADRDPEEKLEFKPIINEFFIYFAILGIELMGLPASRFERAFLMWICLHHPEMLTEKGRVIFSDNFPIDALNELREIPKSEFFQAWL